MLRIVRRKPEVQMPSAATRPEESFSNPFAAINPVEMLSTVLARTNALVYTLRTGALCDAEYDADQLALALDQVAANMVTMQDLVDMIGEEPE